VFISHTGQDGGAKTFAASILRPALEAAGLAVCMDFTSLEPGCKWPEELVAAAANSMVVVVVLSESYTQRFWCMLELDLALHSHQQQEGGEGGSSHVKPLVIPVFYDSPEGIADAASIRQYWSSAGSLRERLRTDEKLGPEWDEVVDGARWSANITAMTGQLHNLRRKTGQAADKDEELQLARKVVKAAVRRIPDVKQAPAVKHIPDEKQAPAVKRMSSIMDAGTSAVVFDNQVATITTEVSEPAWRRLWRFGQGAWSHGLSGGYLRIHSLISNTPHS
jgi:hypothetical protein